MSTLWTWDEDVCGAIALLVLFVLAFAGNYDPHIVQPFEPAPEPFYFVIGMVYCKDTHLIGGSGYGEIFCWNYTHECWIEKTKDGTWIESRCKGDPPAREIDVRVI